MFAVGAGYSDVGRARSNNEDSFFVDDELGLYVVADGMGGSAAGEVASSTAIAAATAALRERQDELVKLREGGTPGDDIATLAGEIVEGACKAVFDKAAGNIKLKGMGCTMTLLLVVDNRACMAHVGDSRLYLVRQGKVSQLSTDHTVANELRMAGVFSKEDASGHPYAHVLSRALGPKPSIKVDTLVMEVVPGDRFMICSDGLSDYIEDPEWVGRQVQEGELVQVVEELVTFANTSGGHDNITSVVVEVRAHEPEFDIVDEMTSDVTNRYDALGQVFMFQGLSLSLLTRVLSHCQIQSRDPGDRVIAEGEPCDRLFVVVEGKLRVEREGHEDGELTSGDYVGAPTLMSPRPAKATLTAEQRTRLLVLDREHFWRLVRARPWLGIHLLERIGNRLSKDLDRSLEARDDGDPTTVPLEPHERL